MKKYLIIKADTNDADYVTKKTEVTDEIVKKLKPVIKAIKECTEDYNWGTGEGCESWEHPREVYKDILTEEQIDLFNNYRPSAEYGIHTIESIELLEVVKETKLL